MIDERYYKDKCFDTYKNASLHELEYARDKISLYGSDGKGRTAEVPLIQLGVLDKLIKHRMEQMFE